MSDSDEPTRPLFPDGRHPNFRVRGIAPGPAPIDAALGVNKSRIDLRSPSTELIDFTIRGIENGRPFADKPSARGLIVATPRTPDGTLDYRPHSPEELRAYALLWDRVEITQHPLIGISHSDYDLNFLKQSGLIGETGVIVNIRSADDSSIARAVDTSIFDYYETHNPGQWAVTNRAESSFYQDDLIAPNRAVLFRLINAVPIPTKDVHLGDVLDFKEKRMAELVALRSHLAEVYQGIIAAPDRPLAELTALAKLDQAIADLIKTEAERGFAFKLSTMGAKVDLGALVAAVGGATLAHSAGLNIAAIAIAGVGGAATRILASIGLTASLKGRSSSSPFQYTLSMRDEL